MPRGAAATAAGTSHAVSSSAARACFRGGALDLPLLELDERLARHRRQVGRRERIARRLWVDVDDGDL